MDMPVFASNQNANISENGSGIIKHITANAISRYLIAGLCRNALIFSLVIFPFHVFCLVMISFGAMLSK